MHEAPLPPPKLSARQKQMCKGSGGGPKLKSKYDYACDLWAAAACGDIAAILSALRHGASIEAKQKKAPQPVPLVLTTLACLYGVRVSRRLHGMRICAVADSHILLPQCLLVADGTDGHALLSRAGTGCDAAVAHKERGQERSTRCGTNLATLRCSHLATLAPILSSNHFHATQ